MLWGIPWYWWVQGVIDLLMVLSICLSIVSTNICIGTDEEVKYWRKRFDEWIGRAQQRGPW